MGGGGGAWAGDRCGEGEGGVQGGVGGDLALPCVTIGPIGLLSAWNRHLLLLLLSGLRAHSFGFGYFMFHPRPSLTETRNNIMVRY